MISREDYKPFLEIILPETNVLSIENILQVEGTNLTTVPSNEEFAVFENNFFEVEALAQAQMFVEDDNTLTDNSGVRPGKWENVPKRFIKENT